MSNQGNLVLSVRVGERVMIGDEIIVAVSRLNGNQAQITFTAPLDIEIDRESIRRRKQQAGGNT